MDIQPASSHLAEIRYSPNSSCAKQSDTEKEGSCWASKYAVALHHVLHTTYYWICAFSKDTPAFRLLLRLLIGEPCTSLKSLRGTWTSLFYFASHAIVYPTPLVLVLLFLSTLQVTQGSCPNPFPLYNKHVHE